MKEKLSTLSLPEFMQRLGSKEPVPGGGGAAAVMGAIAASLGTMAANLTAGKKKYLAYEEDYCRIVDETEMLRIRFLTLIDEDAEGFEPLAAAYSIDKNAPDFKETLLNASINACRAPLEMMRCCCRLIGILEELLDKCSVLLLSDVGCAALAARSGLEAASMNVFVNTRTMKNDGKAIAIAQETEAMLTTYLPRAQKVADTVMSYLRN